MPAIAISEKSKAILDALRKPTPTARWNKESFAVVVDRILTTKKVE